MKTRLYHKSVSYFKFRYYWHFKFKVVPQKANTFEILLDSNHEMSVVSFWFRFKHFFSLIFINYNPGSGLGFSHLKQLN